MSSAYPTDHECLMHIDSSTEALYERLGHVILIGWIIVAILFVDLIHRW